MIHHVLTFHGHHLTEHLVSLVIFTPNTEDLWVAAYHFITLSSFSRPLLSDGRRNQIWYKLCLPLLCRTLSIIFWLVPLGFFSLLQLFLGLFVCLFVFFCLVLSRFPPLCFSAPQSPRGQFLILSLVSSASAISQVLEHKVCAHFVQWLCFHSTPGTLTENPPSR